MPDAPSVEERALASAGRSNTAIYGMVADAFHGRDVRGERLIDVGCGHGAAWQYLKGRFSEYVGVDVVRYNDFALDGCELHKSNVYICRLFVHKFPLISLPIKIVSITKIYMYFFIPQNVQSIRGNLILK